MIITAEKFLRLYVSGVTTWKPLQSDKVYFSFFFNSIVIYTVVQAFVNSVTIMQIALSSKIP